MNPEPGSGTDAGADAAARRPVLRMVSGDATAEEIAALLAVIAARSGAGPADDTGDAPASTWGSPGTAHRGVRASFAPGRHGWRTSYWTY